MDKIMKSQILKLLLIAIFVLMTPLISSSQRTSYLYFIVNLLIISLGADAGLISFFSKSQNNNNTNNLPSIIPQVRSGFSESQNDDKISSPPPLSPHTTTTSIKQQKVSPKVVEKRVSEKIVGVTKLVEKDEVKLQKCPSTPSLFFIWSDEDSSEVKEEEEEISGQELFNKAETFIGNFYNQLKMQREESVESLKGVRFVSDLKICV